MTCSLDFDGGSELITSRPSGEAKDGRQVHISLTVSPVRDANGTVIGASKVARDITERIRAQEALTARARGTGGTRPRTHGRALERERVLFGGEWPSGNVSNRSELSC